ncbi:hypothetical protein [Aeromicrobium sp.]|uniref:hypothetical protein n=1 Tax=Aeromicrobium sp. TaxID=1871063 RepID=UPI00199E1C7F|nr:hypothetical protein [Aeromicrobium sp.]MBC7630947.1 hypothetical protein [Aeromicrobium sp.]
MPTTNDYEFMIGNADGKPLEDSVFYPRVENARFRMTPEQASSGAVVYFRKSGVESSPWKPVL